MSISSTAIAFADDLQVGSTHDLGTYAFTEAEIIEYATKYDPLPFHIDPVRALDWPFGGLISSGIHTMSAVQRMQADNFYSTVALIAGKSIRDVSLRRPVHPGDVLHGTLTIADVTLRDGRADLTTEVVARNQSDDVVISMTMVSVIRRRPTASGWT
ncbi:acyl dehydratase [Gordonia spumicola]|uniref:Acyl dehydratase n=1 Tax=Gordonia spumicola TaxID=589161 RepID=A0A7I9V6D9_9ACTN|nr:MaoC/PaaZ C-terminal domain-containing protein [Gordonia spumicola]GEE00759.1 acyl dehydratase [Gordonia spumicola]GEE00764.1 acyl dehydratase [Gordonia spumicola]GEE01768.1 acyl dehydratase [Gordonia spumicola]